MSPTLFFIGLVLTPFVLGATVIFVRLCFKTTLDPFFPLVAAFGTAIILAQVLTPAIALFVGVLIVGITELLAFRVMIAPRMTWKTYKEARSFRRQLVLHVVLLAGSLLFVLPFLWLLSTSLKEDEEMSKYPPVWVPKQQV